MFVAITLGYDIQCYQESLSEDIMIDICFSDSVAGMVKWSLKREELEEVVPFDMALDIGKLSGNLIDRQARLHSEDIFSVFVNNSKSEFSNTYESYLKSYRELPTKIRKYADEGKSFRVWVSNRAVDKCNLYYLCDILKDKDCDIYTVDCPDVYISKETGKPEQLIGWGACDDLFFVYEASKNPTKLSDAQISIYADRWKKLVEEDAPLRIIHNGFVTSVDEEFYDRFILALITDKPQPISEIGGKFLCKWPGVDYSLIIRRINRLIENRKVKICEEVVNEMGYYLASTISLK